jgi:hypothetical protein
MRSPAAKAHPGARNASPPTLCRHCQQSEAPSSVDEKSRMGGLWDPLTERFGNPESFGNRQNPDFRYSLPILFNCYKRTTRYYPQRHVQVPAARKDTVSLCSA